MSIAAVSLTPALSQTDSQSSVNLLRQTFEQLANSLQTGNLAGAQKALSDLESLVKSNQSTSQPLIVHSVSTRNSTIQNDVAALGQALNFGDLSAAQSDFLRLVKDLQPAGQDVAPGQSVASAHHHGHHPHPEPSATTTETTASPVSASSQNPTGGTVSLLA